jgi:3-oxoacyl-[acyl-carrier protein] reductase
MVLGLSRALAVEYGRLGIRVNTILPGFINTDMTKSMGMYLFISKFLHF